MRKLMNKIDRFCYTHPRFGIPNLMLIIVIGNAAVWLLAQMDKRKKLKEGTNSFFSFIKKDDELIKWYDREDHTIFDVCADDHCQRYQGITKETSPNVAKAIAATRGKFATHASAKAVVA